jgi:3-dehydroquinate synthase class II
MRLVEAEVMSVEHTGLGHRVCVDTTTLMAAEEGMIVGSTGWGGIFVCSETHSLPHMNLREFRVNAGGVHSYVWGPNNVALYLSELQAGCRALAVDVEGRTRVVTVGRVKTERRPLLLIRARLRPEDPSEAYIKTFLQNDWHVRVMGADRKVRNSTLLRPGDRLLAFADEPGRHTGVRISESIVEKHAGVVRGGPLTRGHRNGHPRQHRPLRPQRRGKGRDGTPENLRCPVGQHGPAAPGQHQCHLHPC